MPSSRKDEFSIRNEQRINRLLRVVLLLLFSVSFGLGIYGLTQGRMSDGAIISVVFSFACVFMLWLLRHGSSLPIRILIPGLILVALTYTITQDGTIQSIDVGALYLVIALGAFLLGGRGVLAFGILSLLIITIVYIIEARSGFVPTGVPTNVAGYTTLATAITLTTILLRFAVDWLEQSNHDVRSYARSLEQRTDQLEQTNQELERSQSANVTLLDAIPDVLFRLDRNGSMKQYKPPVEAWSAFPQQPDTAFVWHEFLAADDVSVALESIRVALQTGEMSERQYVKQLDDVAHVYEVRVIPSDSKHVLLMVRDITWLDRREQQEIQARRLESVGLLASGLAHDYNNVLSGIVMRGDMAIQALAKDKRPGVKQQLSILNKSAREMGSFIRELMTYFAHEEVEPALHDINQIVHRSIDMIQSSLHMRVRVKRHVMASDVIVSAEPALLKQLFINMMMNAGQAMEEEGGLLTITTELLEFPQNQIDGRIIGTLPQTGRYVCISFEDTGIGMSDATLERIFERHFSTKSNDKKRATRGIGLNTAPDIIERHRGLIVVKSALDMGTRFCVLLPVLHHIEFRPTLITDLPDYFAFSAEAQQNLIAKGLKQWTPTAHQPYQSTVRADFSDYVSLWEDGDLVACFKLGETHSDAAWTGEEEALHVSNIVVRPSHHGHGHGKRILDYCEQCAIDEQKTYLHLTAENSNKWLTAYYERHGFDKVGEVETYDNYYENLYEKRVIPS